MARAGAGARGAGRAGRSVPLGGVDRGGARRLRGQPGRAAPVEPLDMAEVVRHARSASLPDDTIFTNGAGNFSGWLHRFYRYPALRTTAARSSRRPRARWATACRPPSPRRCCIRERTVVNFAGDGDFLMTGQELAHRRPATARRQLVSIVVDNGTLRHDPHAPGARVPGPRQRHRPAQPGLRRARARLRLAQRERVERTAAVRAGLRARRSPPAADADPPAARRRRDHDAARRSARSARRPRRGRRSRS